MNRDLLNNSQCVLASYKESFRRVVLDEANATMDVFFENKSLSFYLGESSIVLTNTFNVSMEGRETMLNNYIDMFEFEELIRSVSKS